MSLATWNGNLSGYDNVKSNVLADRMAKNRWGSKFKRLYNPLRDANNRVVFTQGMQNCAGTDVLGIIDELEVLRDAINAFFLLSDGSNAKSNSYFSVLVSRPYALPIQIDDVRCSLSLPVAVSEEDQRRVSLFFQKNSTSNDALSYLEPIDAWFKREEAVKNAGNIVEKPFNSKNQLSLYTQDGTQYGHIGDTFTLADNTRDNTILNMYGSEEASDLFRDNFDYNAKFNELFSALNFETWLLKFVNYSYVSENHPTAPSFDLSIVFGVDLILQWIHDILTGWYAYLNNLDTKRAGTELKLIEHLNLCDTLQEQIGSHAGDIGSIWFEFKKEVKPPTIMKDGVQIYDPNYEWWKEEQFKEIRKHFKNFHLYFNFNVGTYFYSGAKDKTESRSFIEIKNSAFYLSGWKIYWLVSACLNIDSRAKRRSFLESLFSFVLLVVALYLTAVSANPVWLKVVLVAITLASYSGALSPKAQLVVAVVMFVYGLSATNIAAMSSAQLFQWAVSNIEMVYKMVKMYEQIKLEEEEDKNVAIYDKQERIMKFIYEDAYSQYDNLYSVLYDYEPKYK